MLLPDDKKVLSSGGSTRKQQSAIKRMRINQHVVRRTDGWAVVGEGNSRDTSVHPVQQQAIQRAHKIAQNQCSEVVIHGEDGRILEKKNYGHAPLPPKD
jgi:hypothetical protein